MQKLTYKTLASPLVHEIPKIKGSRFFASFFPVQSKEEIDHYITELNKKYYDATHNCYARRLGVQANQDLFGQRNLSAKQERANDDGEPTNTAGKPILSVLTGAELFDCLVVVTRYFWGTLLGVGGLIQAYTQTTQAWVSASTVAYKEISTSLILSYSYDQLASVQYLYGKYSVKVIADHYADQITQTIAVNLAYLQTLEQELRDRQISYTPASQCC